MVASYNSSISSDRIGNFLRVAVEYYIPAYIDPGDGGIYSDTEWQYLYTDEFGSNIKSAMSFDYENVSTNEIFYFDVNAGVAKNRLSFSAYNSFSSERVDVQWNVFDGALETTAQAIAGTTTADIALGGSGDDVIGTSDGGDWIDAGAGKDVVSAGLGADTLDGGTGADLLVGGDGDDTYVVDDAGDRVYEEIGMGTDFVLSSVSFNLGGQYIENLTLTGTSLVNGTGNSFDNRVIGNEAANTLSGLGGSDTLDGGGGADTLVGGVGSDTYVTDGGDTITEAANAGTDTVRSSVTLTLAANLENLVLTGTAPINGTGNTLANAITGNAGNNILDGGLGDDVLSGGAGNDTYVVDSRTDAVKELASQGVDTIITTSAYVLAAGQSVETLQFAASTGAAALNLVGNEFANTLIGNAGVNLLYGGAGGDVLNGAGGNDILFGQAGADTFSFTTKIEAGNVDRISDFSAIDDTIRLAKSVFAALAPGVLAETAFKDLSTGGPDASDRILYDKATGGLSYDADGSGTTSAAVQFATLDNKAAITHLDLLVV